MSDINPNVKWTDFVTIVEAGRVADLKSGEVFLNGEYIFTVIIGHTDIDSRTFARMQSDFLALKTNIVGGKDPEELIAEIIPAKPRYPHLEKAREVRRLKREAKGVLV